MTQAKDIPDNEWPIHYRHATINRAVRSLSRKNKLSRHEWSEPAFLNEFDVSGTNMMQSRYRTLESAKSAIDFDHSLRWGRLSTLVEEKKSFHDSGPGF